MCKCCLWWAQTYSSHGLQKLCMQVMPCWTISICQIQKGSPQECSLCSKTITYPSHLRKQEMQLVPSSIIQIQWTQKVCLVAPQSLVGFSLPIRFCCSQDFEGLIVLKLGYHFFYVLSGFSDPVVFSLLVFYLSKRFWCKGGFEGLIIFMVFTSFYKLGAICD